MVGYDAIVVGGGPAGATAAYLLHKFGFHVLLIDKEIFPREKLCAGLLTIKTIRILKEIFNLDLEVLIKDKVIDYSSNYYKVFHGEKLIYEQKMNNLFYYVYRSIYDNYLLELVKNIGVEVKKGLAVDDINLEKNTVYTRNGQKITGKFIIAADGANSIIRKKLLDIKGRELKKNFYKNMATAVEATIPRNLVNSELDYPLIYYGVINWGYGWVFPKKDNLVVGIGGLKNKNGNFHTIFRDYLKLLNIEMKDIKYSGWSLPYGNYLARPVYKNIFLVGDAAGLVEPITGEGIYYAHKSAALAVKVIQKVTENPAQDPEEYYQKLLSNSIIERLDKFKKIRSFLCNKSESLQKPIFSTGIKVFGKQLTKMIQGL